ncbi:hypothetical protein Javan126_0035 [Streptococcus phage Javan126]|uniref:hypothetical protein n=1 Tax=Streptococcus dysgalactiae TaxID=1334 RepID=UPI0003B039B5|nr:hypothetical protein [Streptococcus dysgalactiae]QBX23356.1 hypothetical protein Javan126_0035 [Streptococcus phage Javan126]QBX23852.1 hypothetical protein Javan164_0035 [Streptococcus phage Javan164]BAN93693.1 hypothetical protein SDSE167_1305 [Streptococcus dysgalactiae subsp. equisimilis 167]OCW99965.1 hypothetical protein BBG07_09875 [Streptococcus dysgalactiae subsp. equisimilis]OCX02224.1 hypothetical protein BBG10_05545 [Streptococcus dysgalactiae subsp. equisimilis]
MVRDMLTEVFDLLKADNVLKLVKIKSFERSESLLDDQTSIVILPITAPKQSTFGSDTALSKKFLYQIEVESTSRLECKDLQRRIEKQLEKIGFHQNDAGFERFDRDTGRYLDARTFRGLSDIYEDY